MSRAGNMVTVNSQERNKGAHVRKWTCPKDWRNNAGRKPPGWMEGGNKIDLPRLLSSGSASVPCMDATFCRGKNMQFSCNKACKLNSNDFFIADKKSCRMGVVYGMFLFPADKLRNELN